MIPAMLLIGFLTMVLLPPRWQFFLAVTAAGGLIWLASFFFPEMLDPGTLSWWQLAPAAFGLGALNTAVGAALGWLVSWLMRVVWRAIRGPRAQA